eukprot:TRINITY_DN781875_c0_g1_i1.p1 TRINITY_DN781875_c0_g1~~TRINITY_DN781875_c0_g1_i1.p1  ORF type:complete len:271 (+),score=69.59 TRINITY_DN781875_c0_g1_i1:77-889(+)
MESSNLSPEAQELIEYMNKIEQQAKGVGVTYQLDHVTEREVSAAKTILRGSFSSLIKIIFNPLLLIDAVGEYFAKVIDVFRKIDPAIVPRGDMTPSELCHLVSNEEPKPSDAELRRRMDSIAAKLDDERNAGMLFRKESTNFKSEKLDAGSAGKIMPKILTFLSEAGHVSISKDEMACVIKDLVESIVNQLKSEKTESTKKGEGKFVAFNNSTIVLVKFKFACDLKIKKGFWCNDSSIDFSAKKYVVVFDNKDHFAQSIKQEGGAWVLHQ